MAGQLSMLTRKADAVAESASVLVSRTIREITGEMANLSAELNLASSASDREGVYGMISTKMNRLGKRLNKLMVAQNQAAAKAAAEDAADMTGCEVRYSAARAEAICELVTPAQGENLAAVFTDKMAANMINTLREATVTAMRENAVSGGTLKEMAEDMRQRWFGAFKDAVPTFTDVSGRTWNTQTYFQMNARTNAMRVYNDCLVDNVAREVGTDIMRISKGGDPDCPNCFAWEGCIISISGKTKGLPTYDDARNGGCFHPNCVHTLEYVDEVADADEIALQMAHPVTGDPADADAQDERRYEIDQDRYRRKGMTADEARVAVDRDNLETAIRCGLVREDAHELVANMTDEQVTRLCPNGNPPAFQPVKRVRGGTRKEPKYETERWNHGTRGGVVHINRDADLAHILSVTKADAPKTSVNTHVSAQTQKYEVGSVKWYEAAMNAVNAKNETEAVEILKRDFGLKQVDTGRQYYRMGKVTDSKTREYTAKMVCVALSDLKKRFPDANITLEELNMRHASKSAVACATLDHQYCKVSAMDIAWNQNYSSKDWSSRVRCKELNGTQWTQGHEDVRMNFDTFRHEFGHILTTREVEDEFAPIRRKLGARKYFKEHVSLYASTNCAEAIAETFATITAHDYVQGTLDSRLEDFVYYTMLKMKRVK